MQSGMNPPEKRSESVAAGLLVAALLHTLRVALPGMAPWAAGFSPVGAAALLAGATLPRAGASLLTTLGGLLLGDLVILAAVYHGRHGFPIYAGWPWVYGSLALITLLGRGLAGPRFGRGRALGFAVLATLSHWWITNTGVWLAGGRDLTTGLPYTGDLAGYLSCLAQAIPYQLRFLAGTVVFGSLALALHRLALVARRPAALRA